MGARLPARPVRLLSMRNPFSRYLLLTVALLLFLALTWRTEHVHEVNTQRIKVSTQSGRQTSHSQQRPTDKFVAAHAYVEPAPVSRHTMNCSIDVDYMGELKKKYNLGDGFSYMKRYVKFSREPIQRKSVTKVPQKFFQGSKTIDLDYADSYGQEKCGEPLRVSVPDSPFPVNSNLSDFMFGISTTFKRFSDKNIGPVKEWAYWLSDGRGSSNGGKLILLLLDASEDEIATAKSMLSSEGIDADVFHSDSKLEMAVRYLTLVPTLYNHPLRPTKKWLVTCDDDTFFPNPHLLVERFSAYDPDEELYVGTLSEDVNNIDRHGSQAFGGAGVFISVPLAAKVHKLYEKCKTEDKIRESNSGWGPQGDILLRKCIYENTEVRLSLLRGLYQLDLYGDPSGFYEAGLKPISLHHYKGGGWHIALPEKYMKIAYICGEDCPFMRFQTSDDWIISTSFSVVQYPKGINFNLAQKEATFYAAPQNKGWNLDMMLDPQRPSLLRTGRKLSWDLQESVLYQDNTVSQVYVRKADDWRWVDASGQPMSKSDGVIELVWVP